MYTDCKIPALFRILATLEFQLAHVHGLQARIITIARSYDEFQLAHVHGLQGAWHKFQTLSGPVLPFREPHVRDPLTRSTQVRFTPYHGELLDLFFARLLPSGTGDFDAGPSQLREKQTNPIMLLPYPLTGSFLIKRNFRIWMVIDDFYLSLPYCLLNFNSRMYTDCKPRPYR